MTKNTLDDVIKRSTVEFPRALSLTGIKCLFRAMEVALQAEVTLDVSYTLRDHVSSYSNLSINGKIKFGGSDKYVSDSFESYNSNSSNDRIKGIRFRSIPGYKLGEHRKEVVTLWDKVREYVKKNLSH